ncbi:MAG: clan AA aspartic protease [Chloroflexi bacterium]|uniref:Clan AA aspartic protease n=1 Tax=Candidatus Chlorohelix allophototropha TaxID=3003348 RepID=A0A8T7LQN1_9CHLR|nr:clan AA aspartic protease [Chloroflexota bacterium]WJW66228.1 retroviral-like aspartic protease family protein [Chloroflexota bacterium L227-S17]
MPQVDSIQELGQFFLPLAINGSTFPPHYFILDTGAGMSAIDVSLAQSLNLTTIGYAELAGTAGVINVPIKQIDTLAPLRRMLPVTELTQYDLIATTQDLSQFKVPYPATHEAGLLGNNFLRHFIVELEFLPPALHIYRPQGYLPPGVDGTRFINIWLDGHHIMRVQGRLDGWLEVDLRVDSGAASLSLAGPYLNLPVAVWKKLCDKHPEYYFYTTLNAGGMGGPVELNVARIGSLEIGSLRFDYPSVVVQPEQGIFANKDAVGFISLNLFESRRWMTIDYPAGRIYLGQP